MNNSLTKLQSLEAESSVIGGILLDNSAIAKCLDLQPQMFAFYPYRLMFAEIQRLTASGSPIDPIIMAEGLTDVLPDSFNHIIDVMNNTPSAANISAYVQLVKNKASERKLLQAAKDIENLVLETTSMTAQEKQTQAVRLLSEIAESATGKSEERSYTVALEEALKSKDQLLLQPRNALIGFPTGLHKLNRATNGLRRGDLTVIAGRPSMGKSVLAENIARTIAENGQIVRFQSYEMTAQDLTDRGAAAWGQLDYGRLRKAQMTAEEWDRYNAFLNHATDLKITIDTTMLDIDGLLTRCRAMKQQNDLDLLVVDHLHLMPRAGRDEVAELDSITAKLKRLAMELNIHVLLVAQLNRGKERDTDKRPTMSDIRGSGGIEQNANTIIFPFRPAYYDEQANPTVAELIIAKNRDGERGTLQIGWQGEFQRFTNESDPHAQGKQLEEKIAKYEHDAYAL